MVAVNGMNLKTLGYCDLDIIIGGYSYSITAIVAELNTAGILGLYFMTEYECSIDLKQMCLVMNGKRIRCDMKGKIGCYRVSLVETGSIPPRHEMCTCGEINDYCHSVKCIGIIEPSDTFQKAGKAMVGRILASANENVPVPLMNQSNEEVIVYKDTVVGQFEQVKENASKETLDVKNSSLPEQLENWSNRLQPICRKDKFKV